MFMKRFRAVRTFSECLRLLCQLGQFIVETMNVVLWYSKFFENDIFNLLDIYLKAKAKLIRSFRVQ